MVDQSPAIRSHQRVVDIIVGASCAGTFGLAALALIGWQFDLTNLRSLLPAAVAMNPLSAVCLVLAAIALWMLRPGNLGPQSRVPHVLAAFVAGLGLIRVISAAAAINLGIDQVLFHDKLMLGPHPNRMPPNTAFALFFVGLGLVGLEVKTRRGWRPAQGFFLLSLSTSLMALIGYAYRASTMYEFVAYAPMAPNSALALMLLSLGGLFARTDSGLSQLILSDSPGGVMIRRLLVLALVVPAAGWLRLRGEKAGLYDLGFGTAAFVLFIVISLIGVIWYTARALDQTDRERRLAEDALRKSLARQNRLVESNPMGVITATTDGLVVEANAAFLDIVGYRKEDLPLHTDAITPAEWRDRTHLAIEELREHGVTRPWEKEYLRKDGTRVSVLVGGALVPETDGQCVAFVLDQTNWKRAEAEIEHMRVFQDSIIENLPSMVFVKDARELRFVRINKAAEELLGYSRNELIGKSDYDFFPREQADFFVSKDRQVLESATMADIAEEPIETKGHGARLLRTKKVPIIDAQGERLYLLGISEDITERRETEQRIEALHREVVLHSEQLHEANKELEAFSYSVSHDLRAPLRHLSGFADLLLRMNGSQLDEIGQRRLRVIAESAQRMGQLIDDLLLFSRTGRAEFNWTHVDLNQLVRDVLAELEEDVKGREISWTIEPLPVVEGDSAMLRQVLTNLIANAVKYTATREVAVIEVRARESPEDGVVVSIKDNGVGFDNQYVGKLFGVFQRLHRAQEFPGTGIGLANVRRIIHRHGGRTWAEGAVDQGATFYFSLPRHEKGDESWAA